MQYNLKPKEEGTWGALQAGLVTLITALLISQGVENEVAVPAGAVAGILVRPIGGYLVRFLPRPKTEGS